MAWTPPERPRWVERLIAHGEAAGGAARLISLDQDQLIESAMASTGLDDFGDFEGGAWRDDYAVLMRSLDEEAQMHAAGRLVTRTEILQTLRNRLQLAELWKRRPELLATEIDSPVFIVGSPRSGTSILHELMAADPSTRSPAMWEMQHPVAAVEGDDERAELCDRVTQFWHDLQPEYETMHANSGYLPNECIFITAHEFLSDHWGGNHVAPSYSAHLAAEDQHRAYRFHRRFLATLQAARTERRWLLKAPSHLFQLPTLFDVYPDARIVRTHRDPLKTLASSINLMGTLKWMRCSNVDMSEAAELLPLGYAYIFRKEIDQRADGTLPDDRFIDVQFRDLVRSPMETVAGVYERLGWELSDETRRRVAEYAHAKPKDSRGAHRYSLESTGLDAATERDRFAFYMDAHGIEPEA